MKTKQREFLFRVKYIIEILIKKSFTTFYLHFHLGKKKGFVEYKLLEWVKIKFTYCLLLTSI